jgi:SAM-dependent methyltransferase
MGNTSDHTQNVRQPDTRFEYSKSSAFYLNAKNDFFANNNELLTKTLIQNKLYATQPRRESCKVCQQRLPQATDFHSHKVDYVFCEHCSHLNGRFDDTKSFIEDLYISECGGEYSKNYIDEHFLQRISDIYIPKVDFLLRSLPLKRYKIFDVGCGSGHFVCASLFRGMSANGIDVNKTMVDFGNNQISNYLNQSPLTQVGEEMFFDSIVRSAADVISVVGVIEHLREPQKFFAAFRKSKAKYIYYSVPMFSLSVALENIFKNVFPRQLSGGHTHLFTESSLKKMNEIIGVQSIAEWRFGTDAMDLYRHVITNLQANQSSQKMIDFLCSGIGNKIDDIQYIFDKNHFCSEIHLVAAKH